MPISVIWGLVAGFVGALVFMALVAPMMRRGPTLMSHVAARAMGGDPASSSSMMAGMVLHVIYGTVMGGIFAWGSEALITIANPLVNGLLFGILLFVVAVVIIMPLSRAPMMPMPMVGMFFIVHLIYGLVLGSLTAWLSGVSII